MNLPKEKVKPLCAETNLIPSHGALHRPEKQHHLWGYVIIFLLFSSNIYRAFTQSIVHDEALTFLSFVEHGWKSILLCFDSNNHTLNSILMRLSTSALGLSSLSMRIPALLGGLLYMLALERLCRTFCKAKLGYLLSLAVLTTSPFILDYLVAARGYSLALGFLMLAVLLSILELNKFGTQQNRPRYYVSGGISCLCALSVASNFSFAFVNASLLLIFFFSSLSEQRRASPNASTGAGIWRNIVSLLIPGALLYVALNPAIFRFNSTTLYFGSRTWPAVCSGIIAAMFDDFAIPDLGLTTSAFIFWIITLVPFLFILCCLLSGLFALQALWQNRAGEKPLANHLIIWLFIFVVILVTLVFHGFAFILFGVLLPAERTGIFFVPLATLLVCITVENCSAAKLQRLFKYVGRISFFLIISCFLLSFHTTYFREWRYDSGSKEVYLALRSAYGKSRAGIGINWLFEPGLNFYRVYYKDVNLPLFTRDKPKNWQTYFVLLPESSEKDLWFVLKHHIHILFNHPHSAAVVGIKP